MKIFLSAVSGQFKACRDALRSDLIAVGAEVVVQEDFQLHGASLLEKLERYIGSCDRIIALVGDDTRHQTVTFTYRDYRHGSLRKELTLSALEFIRRFSLHILPPGLVRIRHYG